MALSIPESDRIKNKVAIPSPKDYTRKDADLIMAIFDKIVNGEYRMKTFRIFNTMNDMYAEIGEPGELAYCLDNQDQHYKWSVIQQKWIEAF